MTRPVHNETVNPNALSEHARGALVDELYAAHAQIFGGVSKAEFAKYVVDSPADRTRIQVYRDAGRVVGYFAVHTFVEHIDGQRWVVLRAEAGKLPAYRRSISGTLMIAEVLRACLRHPRARKAYLGCFVHPSAYVAMGHVAPKMYPHWEQPTPADTQRVMDRLANNFGLDRVDEIDSGLRKVGWITRETDEERASWARRHDVMSEFYMARNPGYRRGDGLVVLIPLSAAAFVEGTLRHMRRALGRRFKRLSTARLTAPQTHQSNAKARTQTRSNRVLSLASPPA